LVYINHENALPKSPLRIAQSAIINSVPSSDLARELVLSYSWNPIAYQILNPGIRHWFSNRRDAIVGYVTCNHIRVVAGAPVCSPERIGEVIEEFEADADRARERICYFHVGPRFVDVVGNSTNHSVAAIGALPFWNPMEWHSILQSHSSLRYQVSRARNKGIEVSEMPARMAAESRDLRDIRQQWLSRKHLPPLHFLIEPDIFGQLADRRLFIARRSQHVIGYLLCSPMPNRKGWLFEQWARADRAPLGTSELLVHAAMSAFAGEGSREVTMGLVPLSARVVMPGEPGPQWLRALFRFMRLTANPLYNFKGLEHYKYKFRPHYSEPAYAVVNDGRFHPVNVFAIAHAFAGSPLQLFAWQILKKNFDRLMNH
jgi:phosphatidylglycerol lysyltransferase